jgi:hypothetical protein
VKLERSAKIACKKESQGDNPWVVFVLLEAMMRP